MKIKAIASCVFLQLVDNNDKIVWSTSGNSIGDEAHYNYYRLDYDAEPLCACGCDGDC